MWVAEGFNPGSTGQINKTALARNRLAEMQRFASKMETESISALICVIIYFSTVRGDTNGGGA